MEFACTDKGNENENEIQDESENDDEENDERVDENDGEEALILMLGMYMGMLAWGKEGAVLLSIPTSSAGVSGGVASPASAARIHDIGVVQFGALGMSFGLGSRSSGDGAATVADWADAPPSKLLWKALEGELRRRQYIYDSFGLGLFAHGMYKSV